MKTPNEIKLGLECCLIADDDMCRCDECPYSRNGYNTLQCDIELGEDAIDLQTKLQNAIDEWEMVATSPGAVEDMARENTQMAERIRQLEREREKLLNFAAEAGCEACRYAEKEVHDFPCCECDHCYGEHEYWKWRGVEVENDGENA